MEKINYQGWPNGYRIANKLVELVVTADVGPRIIRYSFVGGENIFREFQEELGQTGDNKFHLYGGHRLWHSPESLTRTYAPDNFPVQVEALPGGGRFTAPVESNGVQKEMVVQLAKDDTHVTVTHRLHNHTAWPIELAPWALSVMGLGGKGIYPVPPRKPHGDGGNFIPTHSLIFWPCTKMADPRWAWGNEYMLLRQDPQMPEAQKVGMQVPDGWAAYARNNQLFVKKFFPQPNAVYPDQGCQFETYTDATFLELETLGPIGLLQPGAAVEHIEHWFLFRDVPMPNTDADVNQYVLPKVKAAQI